MKRNKKSYTELKKLETFEEKFNYLRENGAVGIETFGFDRYLNQVFYKSKEWKDAKRKVLIRDNGCDLGDDDRPIMKHAVVHHMNPISQEDIENRNPDIFDPEYLITVSLSTHNAIHYSDENAIKTTHVLERKPNDQCPWK